MHRKLNLYAFILALSLGGCAATSTVSVWQDDTFTGPPFDNLLVVGVSGKPGNRQIFESEFVKAVIASGKNATASLTMIPGATKLSRESVKAVIADTGFDAVLVTRMVGVDTRDSYVAPEPYYRTYNGYYNTIYEYAYQPGYYHSYSVYHIETNVYDAESEALVWTMRSEAVAPDSVTEVVASLTKQIIARLSKDGRI